MRDHVCNADKYGRGRAGKKVVDCITTTLEWNLDQICASFLLEFFDKQSLSICRRGIA